MRDTGHTGQGLATLWRRLAGLSGRRHGQLGQSLVEVAIVVPIALLLFAGTLDMGRLFFARVSIENAAREGAMFAATNPGCDTASRASCADPNTVEWRTVNEVSGLDGLTTTFTCFDGVTARSNVGDCDQGDTYVVTVSDQFDFVTPLLAPIFGGSLTLEASASSAVLNSAFDPSATFVPYAPTPTPTPTASPSPSSAVDCTVGDYVGIRANTAEGQWDSAGFTGAFDRVGNGNFPIAYQDPGPGILPCTSSITVYRVAP